MVIIEGTIDEILRYHYNVDDDILSLQHIANYQDYVASPHAIVPEVISDGSVLIRSVYGNIPVGLNVKDFWKRLYINERPDSIKEIEQEIKCWGQKLQKILEHQSAFTETQGKLADFLRQH